MTKLRIEAVSLLRTLTKLELRRSFPCKERQTDFLTVHCKPLETEIGKRQKLSPFVEGTETPIYQITKFEAISHKRAMRFGKYNFISKDIALVNINHQIAENG